MSEDDKTGAGGVLITEGATLRISGLSISISESGEVTFDGGQSQLHYDVCPTWLQIVLRHLGDAKLARDELRAAHDAGEIEGRSKALEREFAASMQAIVSSAIANRCILRSGKEKAEARC
jgi:hypothetical protein